MIMDFTILDSLKAKEVHKEYAAFLGDNERTDYYMKRFEKMENSGAKCNFNFSALFFSTYWCFYRKLFGLGAISFAMNFVGLYLALMMPKLAALGQILTIMPAIICGLFGNYLYMSYARKTIVAGLGMDDEARVKHYDNNGGISVRIALGVIGAFVIIGLGLFFSAGPEAIYQMQQNMPISMPSAE